MVSLKGKPCGMSEKAIRATSSLDFFFNELLVSVNYGNPTFMACMLANAFWINSDLKCI